MRYEIKHRYTNAILFATEAETLKEAVEAAVAAGANLDRANLNEANLDRANLNEASLYGANLNEASLNGASLNRASLNEASLNEANLENTKLPGFQIPQEGALVVWKKLRHGVLAKLCIPADAARTAALVGRKCRAAFAEVLRLENEAGETQAEGESRHEKGFFYRAGERVTPAGYADDIREECQPGIHFWLTREEAVAYN